MKYLYILSLILLTNIVFGQQDFNNYQTLKAQGAIPEDFSTTTKEKVETNKGTHENLSKTKEKIFLESIHYGIDELLHSGMVVYGDEVSLYVRDVAQKLMVGEFKELKNTLRFYTIKSNVANAVSTDQGIVFVTTGLLAQLTSEAQLAFVLAHEIAHYKEKHVVESFEYKMQKNRNTILQLSHYSKEKELEADSLGLIIYNKAGYSKSQLVSSFDVLMYSYLPFEEIPFPTDYYNTDKFYVPTFLFPDKKYEITAIEDYDDSESSHPNIKKRKTEILDLSNEYKKWGDHIFLLGEERFNYVRNICRFESIRTDILDASYADALYSIFILEKDYPNSIYLQRMKAQAWLGLAQYKNVGDINETINRSSELEGEIAAVHYFIKKLNLEATSTVATRVIYDIYLKHKDDQEINAIYTKLIQELADTRKFDLKKFSSMTFDEAAKGEIKKDTVNVESLNKYERIKRKKNYNDPTVFDSSKFYYYGLTDLINDSLFLEKYEKEAALIKDKNDEQEAYDIMSYSEQRKFDKEKEKEKKQIEEFIIVEPAAISYKKNKVDYAASERIKAKYNQAIKDAGEHLAITMYKIDSEGLATLGTDGFNERNVLQNLLTQYVQNDQVDAFPVDYEALKAIEKNYGTTKIVFTMVEHAYSPQFSSSALWLIFYPPALVGYLPIPFMNGNQTEINLLVLDTQTGKIDAAFSYYFKEPTTKTILEARMYDIFQNIKF
jgi:hypothetical protein